MLVVKSKPYATFRTARTQRSRNGAHDWNRTSDLSLTKGVLYRLSYAGIDLSACHRVWSG